MANMTRPKIYEKRRITVTVTADGELFEAMQLKGLSPSKLFDRAMAEALDRPIPKELKPADHDELKLQEIEKAFSFMHHTERDSFLSRIREDTAIPWVLKVLKKDFGLSVKLYQLKAYTKKIDDTRKQEMEKMGLILKETGKGAKD